MIFESARISSRLLLEELGVNANSISPRDGQGENTTTTAADKSSILDSLVRMMGVNSKPSR